MLQIKDKSYLSTLARDRYWLLCFGQLVSQFGNWFYVAATYFLVYKYTNAAMALSLTLVTIFFPKILSFPISGLISDKYDLKKIMIATDVMRAMVVLLLFFVNSAETVYIIYLVNILLSILASVFKTAKMKSIKLMFYEPVSLTKALVLMSSITNIVLVLGSALGAFLYKLFGFEFIIIFDSLSFLVSVAAVYFTCIPQQVKQTIQPKEMLAKFKSSLVDILEGGQLVLNNSVLLVLIPVLFLTLAFTPCNMLATVLSVDYYGKGEIGVGLLLSFLGLGFIIGAIIAGTEELLSHGILPKIMIASPFLSIGLILIALYTHLFIVGAMSFLIIACSYQFITISSDKWFLCRCDEHSGGRFIATVNMFISIFQVISLLFSAYIIDSLSLNTLLVILAALPCLTLAMLALATSCSKKEATA